MVRTKRLYVWKYLSERYYIVIQNYKYMKIKELKKALDEFGVPHTEYSLDGGYIEGGIVLNRIRHFFRKDSYFVYSCERGGVSYFAKECTLDKACEIVYNYFKEYISNYRINIPTTEEKEQGRFFMYMYKMVLKTKELNPDITAVYLNFFKREDIAHLTFSGSSDYQYEGEWHWKEDFTPVELSVNFISGACTDKDAFLLRIAKYMHVIVATPGYWGESFFKGKKIFIGFEGEIPFVFDPNESTLKALL